MRGVIFKIHILGGKLKFPDFCISHGRRNALPLGQKNIFFTVFAMKTAKPILLFLDARIPLHGKRLIFQQHTRCSENRKKNIIRKHQAVRK